MLVSSSIKQIKTKQAPIEIEFIEPKEEQTARTLLMEQAKREAFYSEDLAKCAEAISKTVDIKPKTVKFKVLYPVYKKDEVERRKQIHKESKKNYIRQNKQLVNELNSQTHALEITQAAEQKDAKYELYEQVKEELKQPRSRTLQLQEQDIYTNRIDICYFLQLFAKPFDFKSDFYTYLSQFSIGHELTQIKRVAARTRHQSIVFKDNSKLGLERSQQLRRADSYNNVALQAVEMLAKWCSGYSYLPPKSFAKPYDAQTQQIKDALKIKFLDKKYSGELPLYQVIPAGESVDHLTFDHIEMDKLVKQVREQLDNNVWEPFMLYQYAEVVFKKMLQTNAKSKGVLASYMRCGYENLIYKKFESNFVMLLRTLAQDAVYQGRVEEESGHVCVMLNLSEVIAIVDQLKLSLKPDDEIKTKVSKRYDVAFCNVLRAKQNEAGGNRPLKREIGRFHSGQLQFDYSGCVKYIQEGENAEEEVTELSDEQQVCETYQGQPQQQQVEQAEQEKAAEDETQRLANEEEQRRIALEQEKREEEVLQQMMQANDENQQPAYQQDYAEPAAEYPAPEKETLDLQHFMQEQEAPQADGASVALTDAPETLYSVVHEVKPNLPEEQKPEEPMEPLELVYDNQTKDFFRQYVALEQNPEAPTSSASTSSRRRHRKTADNQSDVSGISEQSESHSVEGKHASKRKSEQQNEQMQEPSDVSHSSERKRRRRRELPQMQVQSTVEHYPYDQQEADYATLEVNDVYEPPEMEQPPAEPAFEDLPPTAPAEPEQEQAPQHAEADDIPYDIPQELPHEEPPPLINDFQPTGQPLDLPPVDDILDLPPTEDMLNSMDLPSMCDIASEDLRTGSVKSDLPSGVDQTDAAY